MLCAIFLECFYLFFVFFIVLDYHFLPLLKNAGIDFGIDEHTVHMSLLGIVVLYTATFLWPYANKVRFALSLFGLGFLFAALSFPEGTIETVITIVEV